MLNDLVMTGHNLFAAYEMGPGLGTNEMLGTFKAISTYLVAVDRKRGKLRVSLPIDIFGLRQQAAPDYASRSIS